MLSVAQDIVLLVAQVPLAQGSDRWPRDSSLKIRLRLYVLSFSFSSKGIRHDDSHDFALRT